LVKAFPVVRRALKVLTDREVSPQLGLLKSTLLQLDSTFSERDYGASTFRDFIEKMATAGYVNLKQVDRSLLVELKDQFAEEGEAEPVQVAAPVAMPAMPATNGQSGEPVNVPPAAPPPMLVEEGVRAMQEAFQNSKVTPHWPMYLRNVKQFIKNAIPTFDEHRYGFHSFLEAVRSAQRAGLFRWKETGKASCGFIPVLKLLRCSARECPAWTRGSRSNRPLSRTMSKTISRCRPLGPKWFIRRRLRRPPLSFSRKARRTLRSLRLRMLKNSPKNPYESDGLSPESSARL
jgi:hypothetical protein